MNFGMRFKYQHLVSSGSLWSFSSGLLIEIVYPFLLRKADLVLVQHEGQKKILAKKKIKSLILSNLIDLNESVPKPTSPSDHFIYVGSLDRRKGFTEFFELIKRTSDCPYK